MEDPLFIDKVLDATESAAKVIGSGSLSAFALKKLLLKKMSTTSTIDLERPFTKRSRFIRDSRERGGRRISRQTFNSTEKRAIAKIARRVDLKQREMKYFSLGNTGVEVHSNRLILLTNQTVTGDGPNDREGDEILLRKLQFHYTLTGAADFTQNLCRVILFQWMDSATPAAADILDFSVSGAVLDPMRQYNTEGPKSNMFRILYDASHWVFPQSITYDTANTKDGSWRPTYRRVNLSFKKPKKIEWSGSSPKKGHIWYLCVTDSTSTPSPVLRELTKGYFHG